MGSLKNWMDTGQQERDALNFALDDKKVSVDVYRRGDQGGVAGLTTEAHDHGVPTDHRRPLRQLPLPLPQRPGDRHPRTGYTDRP
jgi:hypothetical protein